MAIIRKTLKSTDTDSAKALTQACKLEHLRKDSDILNIQTAWKPELESPLYFIEVYF